MLRSCGVLSCVVLLCGVALRAEEPLPGNRDELQVKPDTQIAIPAHKEDDQSSLGVMRYARQLRGFFELDKSPKRTASRENQGIWLELWHGEEPGYLVLVDDDGIKIYANGVPDMQKAVRHIKRITKSADGKFSVPKGNYGSLKIKK